MAGPMNEATNKTKPSEGVSTEDPDLRVKERHWSEPEEVDLPSSGVTVTVCRPTKAYWGLLRSQWPQELVEKCDFLSLSAGRGTWTPEETIFLAQELQHLIILSFIEGILSTGRCPDISLDVVLDGKDAEFIRDYLLSPTLGEGLRDPFGMAPGANANSGSGRVN